MHWPRAWSFAGLICAALAALVLGACGGGADEPEASTGTSSVSSEEGSQALSHAERSKKSGAGQGQSDGSVDGSSARVDTAPLKISGGGSAQFRVKGGDNSVQDYGAEADVSELRQVAEFVHSFYVARVAGEWARACSYLAQSAIEGFEELAAGVPRLKGKGCPAVLDALTEPLSPSRQRQLTAVDAAALRTEGEQGFLIYNAPPNGAVYSMPLWLEGGEWKPTAAAASALVGAKWPMHPAESP